MKLDSLKNPMYFMSEGTVLIQVESQVVSRFRSVSNSDLQLSLSFSIIYSLIRYLRLNEETYTAFIEFTRRNCGVNFIKAFGAGKVDVQILGRLLN